jgi:multidrug efflux pump subunit AcrB
MWLIRMAMGRPVTIMVLVFAFVLMAGLALVRMKVDIFPEIKLPRVTVVQPYGGMDPAQMEGYMVTFYEQHFFYISGVDHVSSRTIQGASVMDIYFQPDVDMADAMAQVVAQVERSKAYMPPGTVTPFILRYDVGNVPVGFLVFSSENRTLGEVQDLVYARVRPLVSTTPGVSTPPPFGGNQRSIVITVDSAKLSQYHLSSDDIVEAINSGNVIMPSGVVRTGDLQRISSVNSVVANIQDLGNIPLTHGVGTAVYLKDIATVKDDTDILTGYALVNGRRTVYMAISKQASASTMSVVDGIKSKIDSMQSLLPSDVKVAFEFDQSVYVTEALRGLIFEGGLGAILTGGVVLLFLRDLRSSLIVVLNIPFALMAAVVGLWMTGQTVNIMTLSGLSLAVGILVDEATVTIENIHSHLARGTEVRRAIYDASLEVVVPRLLAMLSVISVFTPSFFMVGATQSLFVPLSLAVGLAMFASYVLSGTFVPVMCAWLLKGHAHRHEGQEFERHHTLTSNKKDLMARVTRRYQRTLIRLMKLRWAVIAIFVVVASSSVLIYPTLGSEIFPAGNPKGFQLRLKLPVGTRFEKTEEVAKQVLDMINEEAGGKQNVEVTIGYVGTQPPSYAVSNLYMWTSGPQECVLLVEYEDQAKIVIRDMQEKLRKRFAHDLPDLTTTFEAGDIVNKVMNFGAATPIQVDVSGPNFEKDKTYGRKLVAALQKLTCLRDVSIVQPLDYPTIDVVIDRIRAGQLGVTVKDIGRALISSTYSSRFVAPIFWRDAKSGLAYQVQMQVPQDEVHSLNTVGQIPVKSGGYSGPFVRDVANVSFGSMSGEFDHYNMQRLISISANLASDDLGGATREVERTIKNLGETPRGLKVNIRGQVPTMRETFFSLSLGVLFAVVSIFLLLVGFFQSVRLSLIIVSVIPAILAGAVLALALTHTTINVQSFMGAIMATGVGVANSILVVVFSEERRMLGISSKAAAITGASARLRPVLMTSIAMIAGMVPMALGLSEGGDRTAPLGRAVIGGLLVSTMAVLLVLPQIYAIVQRRSTRRGASVLPPGLE